MSISHTYSRAWNVCKNRERGSEITDIKSTGKRRKNNSRQVLSALPSAVHNLIMIKTKIETAEEVRNANLKNLVIADINKIFCSTKAKTMPHGSKEQLSYLAQANEQDGTIHENKLIIQAIDIKIAQYEKEERKGKK